MPEIDRTAFLAEGSRVIGNVKIGARCGVWYNAVIRGDLDSCEIGEETNIQDNAVLHMDPGYPIRIGSGVSVGHNAVLHGCSVGDNTVIGMGAVVLNGARIGRDCMIGAGAVVTGGTQIPDGSLAFGNPAKVRRKLTEEEIRGNRENARTYVDLAVKAESI